jgi:hypothetical protein
VNSGEFSIIVAKHVSRCGSIAGAFLAFQHVGIDPLHFGFARRNRHQHDRQQQKDQRRRHQIVSGENRFGEGRDTARHFLNDVQRAARCCRRERNGARQAGRPHHIAHIGNGHQQSEIHIANALGHLAGSNAPTTSPKPQFSQLAKAPARNSVTIAPVWFEGMLAIRCRQRTHRARFAQRNTGREDQRHLHGEGENGPDAVIPGRDDLIGVGRCEEKPRAR